MTLGTKFLLVTYRLHDLQVSVTSASIHQMHIDLHLPYQKMIVSSDRTKEMGYGTLQDVIPADVLLEDKDVTPAVIKNLTSDKV